MGAMKTNLNRASIVSLFLSLGLMAAPLGASEPTETPVLEPTATAQAEAEVVAAEIETKAQVDEAKAHAKVEEKAAEIEAAAIVDDSNAAVLAEARQARANFHRAKRAKNRREWVKFAFTDNGRKFDLQYFLGHPTPAQRAANARQWADFAFGAE